MTVIVITEGGEQREMREQNYWCTFADVERRVIATLSSATPTMPVPDGAEVLSGSDERVQHALNPPEGRTVQRLRVETLDDLFLLADRFDSHSPKPMYRGQSNYDWRLQTPLERNVSPELKKFAGLERYEYRVFAESRRRLHHYIDQLPDLQDRFSWLALLRHHGVPTRLLDVTRAFFIACYFAVRDSKPNVDAALWVFSSAKIDWGFSSWSRKADQTWLRASPFPNGSVSDSYRGPLPSLTVPKLAAPTIDSLRHEDALPLLDYPATIDAALRGYVEKPGIAVAEPFWLSRRLDVQQGAFLIPFNVRESFESNLSSFLSLSIDSAEEHLVPRNREDFLPYLFEGKVFKVRIPSALHGLLRNMLETMNIRELTLFPDAEGALSHVTSFVPVDGR